MLYAMNIRYWYWRNLSQNWQFQIWTALWQTSDFKQEVKHARLYPKVSALSRQRNNNKHSWEAMQRIMAAKLTIMAHKITIQLHLVTAVPLAVLAPGGQSENFRVHPRILCWEVGNRRTWEEAKEVHSMSIGSTWGRRTPSQVFGPFWRRLTEQLKASFWTTPQRDRFHYCQRE